MLAPNHTPRSAVRVVRQDTHRYTRDIVFSEDVRTGASREAELAATERVRVVYVPAESPSEWHQASVKPATISHTQTNLVVSSAEAAEHVMQAVIQPRNYRGYHTRKASLPLLCSHWQRELGSLPVHSKSPFQQRNNNSKLCSRW